MCGIVGALVFKNNNFEITLPYIEQMRDAMAHRGPDGFGIWISDDRRFGMGHRRLSILDLSEMASQPMCNEDQTLWLSFNGEIYNHEEIRAELIKIGGHKWKTDHSDTEMILHAFEEWGIDCLDKFRGMFAIALWDTKKRELWLIRDRIGIKPLYYSTHNGRIVFASEIKALLQDPDQRRSVNEDAFYDYLSFLTTPAPQTLFDGIKKLSPGTWLRINENEQVYERRYWDLWNYTTPLNNISENDICQLVLSELRSAVKYRKVSDVPVGVFLSGGVDSSTNTVLFAEGENSLIKTFSIGYQGEYQSYKNETSYARKIAEKVGAIHHELFLTIDDLIDFLPKLVHLQDEPLADPVCVPLYYVSKLARDNGVPVCQVGEGADELFFGYEHWKSRLKFQSYNDLPVAMFFKRLGLKSLQAFDQEDTVFYELLRRATIRQPIFWGGSEGFTEMQKKNILSQKIQRKIQNRSSWEAISPIRKRFEDMAWEKSHLNWMTYLDLNFRLPELLLMRVDKMSMGVSLEARVPFLDHKFVEMAMSIPSSLKIKNGTLKYILKKAVRGIIPDEIIDRKKQGFAIPLSDWLSEKLKTNCRENLDSFMKETDYFDQSAVIDFVERDRSRKVWQLLNFIMWWKHFIYN
jgi:asparagine synthase (glutamine-hydrolysing)